MKNVSCTTINANAFAYERAKC